MTLADSHARMQRPSGGRPVLRSAFVLGASIAIGLVCACGSKGSGIDVCKQVETARCQAAPACNVSLTPPYYTSGTAVDACIRYYDVACLDGLEVGVPSSAEVTACIDAISAPAGCPYVTAPQNSPACSWLSTSDAGTEAATNVADATDAADALTADAAPDALAADAAADAENAGD